MSSSKVSHLDDQVEEIAKAAVKMSKPLMNKEKFRVREYEFRSSNIQMIGVQKKIQRKMVQSISLMKSLKKTFGT